MNSAPAIDTHWVPGKPALCYDKTGSGPPVVFLHGIGGNRTNWTDQLADLSHVATAIAWDARGYGRSDDYDGPLSFSDFGNDLARLLDACGIQRAHLVGLSMGARILLDFFPRHSSRVATLTLCDCFFSYEAALSPEKQREFIELRQKPLREGRTLADMAPALIDSLVGPNCSDEASDRLRQSLLDIHVESYLKTIAASVGYDARTNLGEIDVPVQLIYGAHDRLTPPSIGETMLAALADARLEIIPDAGHLSNLEQPATFNKILRSFLADRLQRATYF